MTAEPTLSHRRVLHIALPIVLSHATVPILGAVDTGVIGQLGLAAPIAAVGVGSIALTAIYWIFGFLRMGTTGLVSQAHGARDQAEIAALFTRSALIGLMAGLGIILLHIPLFSLALKLSPASAQVEALANDYMQIRVFSAPAMIMLYGITGWLIALERTRSVLVLQLWMNGLNMGLDVLFVLGFDWGIEGVAWATFIAEWGGLLLGLWLCRDVTRGTEWRDWPSVFNPERLRNMMAVNTDIMLRSVMLQVVFVSFLFLGGKFGDVTQAANQVLLQFLYITGYALDGFAFAAETLVGQALGLRNRALLRRSALLTSFWGLIVNVILALVFWLFGGVIIDIMAKAPEVQSEARIYLPYMVLSPILGLASWMLDGIFIGATRSRDMRNMMAISLVAYLLALLVLLPTLGNHGLWGALLFSFVIRAITLGWRYPALEAQADQP